ncbi:MAG: class I SAM-dependent methyltransferase [Smithella sp.]|nr:class I SAM-dependent methyltransferase [Smithella sp.]
MIIMKMKDQKRNFDKEAATWDEHPARVKLAEDVARAMTQQVTLKPDMDVLDFGCGTGLLTLRLAPFVKSVTGTDTSQGMLDVLKAKADKQGQTNVYTRQIRDSDALPGPYDVIVSSMTFHHIQHVEPLLTQLFQALNMPGYLCVADLDLDQGEFHEDNTGVFHLGFERTALHALFRKVGFPGVKEVTATEVKKPTRKGDIRYFSVFLMIGEKTIR